MESHPGLSGSGDLYASKYDFPLTMDAPRLRYLLATTQRSGSTLLAMTLWRTGGFGAPLEYLRLENIELLTRRLGATTCAGYWRAIQRYRTSSNGVFGFKAFASHVRDCRRDIPELLDASLPADRVVYLVREDKESQAISLARATQTNAWIAGETRTGGEKYDRQFIAGCLRYLQRQEAAWLRFFDRTKASPVSITYETLVAHSAQTTQSIARAFGVDLDGCAEVTLPELRRQADESSREWLRRFRSPEAS
jgi:trehalose 2-sulfotransferase